jgi:hypothetical protein
MMPRGILNKVSYTSTHSPKTTTSPGKSGPCMAPDGAAERQCCEGASRVRERVVPGLPSLLGSVSGNAVS